MSSDRVVRLPSWVAEVSFSGDSPGLSLLAGSDGCRTHPFGAGDDSLALFEGFLFDAGGPASAGEGDRAGGGAPEGPASGAAHVAAAYRRWGEALFERLDGSFAAAVWDADSRRLVAGHDAFGHHPLFYRWSSRRDRLWLATNVLALAHCGRFPLVPHRLNLALNLRLARPTPGETYFEGIERLPPGHRLEARSGAAPRPVRFWLPVPESGEPDLEETTVLSRLEGRLLEAVERRMRLRPDGIMLSGGLDSVCIAALAGEYTRSRGLPPLVAYSARHHPDDPSSYEEAAQDRVAERLGMPQCLSNETDWLGSQGLIEASLDEVRAFPCPSIVFWAGGYMGFARWAAARGDRWFLTGSGGDEWLTVDPSYAADLMRKASLLHLASFVLADASGTGASLPRVLRYQLWSWGARLLVGEALERLAPGRLARRLEGSVGREIGADAYPDPELVAAVRRVALGRRRRALGLERRGGSFYRDSLRQAWQDSYVVHEREVAYHAFRTAGTVYVSPYHDRQLLEFLCRVPPHLLFRGSRYKGMIREIATRRLPGLDLERQRKRYSTEPTSSYRALEAELPAMWRRIGCRRVAELGLVDRRRMEREFDSRVVLGHDSRVRLYALLCTEAWLAANQVAAPETPHGEEDRRSQKARSDRTNGPMGRRGASKGP